MTTTRERREEYHTNVVRSLGPAGPLSPGTHTNRFDRNLDNLLEDLQASVSRPGSSLGQPMLGGGGGGSNYTTTREVQYLQPANVTTVVRERSTSPSMQSSKVYKTAKYEYKTSSSSSSGGNTGVVGGTRSGQGLTEGVSDVYQRNINQLDSLLNDLERERDSSLDRSRSLSRTGIDSSYEPGSRVVETTHTYSSNRNPVARELVFDSPGSYEVRQSRSRRRSPSYENASTTVKNVSYSSDTNNGIYGGINRSRTVTPVRTEQYYTETRTATPNSELTLPRNVHYNETVTVDSAPASKALANIPLSDDILPRPNTKVTTTVRTYTYQLPPDSELNQTLSYRNEAFSQTSNTLPVAYPERDVSPSRHVSPSHKTVLVKNETINTSNNVQEYPVTTIIDHQLPPNTAKSIYYKKDTKHSTTNYYPAHPNGTGPYPPQSPNSFRAIEGPPSGPNTYIYREERHNTTNNRYGSPVPNGDYPDRAGHPPPAPPTTVTYKYSSTTTNATRNVFPPPPEREPLLQPFPTDGIPQSEIDGNPPKRVEDLMATLGENGQITYMSKHSHTENGTGPRHRGGPGAGGHPREQSPPKVTIVEEPLVDSKAAPPANSKNVAGPPVYYPPGHEMFAKKESEAAAWRAQGEYAKASGKYMYEAESKSKTSSKSGAAVVPVCLPLCCAMPCSIM
ncbi:rho GTPase-activating protein gacJ [Uranotaenia lowii]|uniref:rho GTPase-activating protein gacJ n=1 Tax=Uranotaenia lowii TaxID=190385 RepID=UPI00247A1BB9|nr:rho GTPase-activating protein gacJ [Uranotaenia lowii]XP_055609437.1 rho GTPase-activating protein gacJ [Uranotaenia lowii]